MTFRQLRLAGVVACLSLACVVEPGAADEGAENDDTETGGGQGVCDDVDSSSGASEACSVPIAPPPGDYQASPPSA